jgi:branched-chain amino acid aminotransferase
MSDNRIVFMNGDYVPWDRATLHLMSHSLGRGSAIFEVLGFHDTNIGPVIFRLDEHILRMFRTAELLEMKLPFSYDDLCDAVIQTTSRNNLRSGYIKIIGYYPQIAFEILPPQETLDIAIFIIDSDQGHVEIESDQGVSLCISRWMKLDPRTVPVAAKVAANYLNGMMARMEAAKRGFDYAVMLDTNGLVAEGGTESIFFVKNGTLMTPSLETVLDSITRKSLIQVSEFAGIDTMEGHFSPNLLFEADEIFLSGTPSKLLPVHKIDEHLLDNIPGPLTRELSQRMGDIIAGRDDHFSHWLFQVK